jgi:hypothetical protein
MKSLLLAITMAATSFALAQGGGAPAASATTDTKVESEKGVRMECLKKNPKLKGKALAHCVKENTK